MLEDMDRKTISLARLTKDADRIVRDIDSSGTVYSIKRPGGRTMLLMDEEYFDGWRTVAELMQRPNWREELVESRSAFAAGRFRTLDEIERELGLDRPAHSRSRGAAPRTRRTGATKGARRTSRARSRSA